jgi:hypothetical protein
MPFSYSIRVIVLPPTKHSYIEPPCTFLFAQVCGGMIQWTKPISRINSERVIWIANGMSIIHPLFLINFCLTITKGQRHKIIIVNKCRCFRDR